jgi:hypothetical protein
MAKDELEEEFPSNAKSKRVAPIRPAIAAGTDIIVEGDKKKVRRVVRKGGVKRRKKSVIENFLGDDTRSVGNYVLYDVLVPAAKNTIQEMIEKGIEMLLFGETRSSRSRSSSRRDEGRTSIVSYGSFYKDRDRREPPRSNGRFNLDDIVFRSSREAETVLEEMVDLLDQYEQVTVQDYFELAGIDEKVSWVHNKWGWDNLARAYTTHVRGGYAIVLPKPIELD